MKLTKILLPVDFSEQGDGAAEQAAALARHFGAGLILLHVNPIQVPALISPREFSGPIDTGWIAALEAQARKELEAYHKDDLAGIEVRKIVVTGDPAASVVDVAHIERPGLIVMPTHGYGPFRKFLLGSVTSKVLHDVDAPVWTGVHLQRSTQPMWKRIGTVICAIDLRTAEAAVVWARDFASEFNAELMVVHAAGESEPPNRGAAAAAEACEHIRCLQKKFALRGEVLIEEGSPARVVQAATSRNADLIVIGRSRVEGVLGRLRPNAYSIVRDAPCPVVSV